MKRTQVARHTAEVLHTAEASMEETLANSKKALERLVAAKTELGLTGTMGDAAIGRWADSVATLEQAQREMFESHKEAAAVLKAVDIRGVSWTIIPTVNEQTDDARVA